MIRLNQTSDYLKVKPEMLLIVPYCAGGCLNYNFDWTELDDSCVWATRGSTDTLLHLKSNLDKLIGGDISPLSEAFSNSFNSTRKKGFRDED